VRKEKWVDLYNYYKGIKIERTNKKWSGYEVEVKPNIKAKIDEYVPCTE
jgi:hypothetical protein